MYKHLNLFAHCCILACLPSLLFSQTAAPTLPAADVPVPDLLRKDPETRKNHFYVELKMDNGGLLPATDSTGNDIFEGSYYNGIDVRFAWESRRPSVYQTVYRGPRFGLGWYTATFRQDIIGQPNALYGFVDIPFKRPKSRWEWIYGLGLGLSYNFFPYDPEENPANYVIGSKNNVYINVYGEARYQLSSRWDLGAGLGFKHFSNGSMQRPNLGINAIPLVLMAQYKIDNASYAWNPMALPKYQKHWLFDVYWGNASKNNEYGDDNFWKTVVGFAAMKQIGYKYRLGLGWDFMYASKAEERVEGDESEFSKGFSTAPLLAWEWAITERLYMPIYFAVYVKRHKENDEREAFYERIGLRYKIKNHLMVGIALKAHGGVADMVEWTVGYSFHKDPNTYH